jgi:hypothetical protein
MKPEVHAEALRAASRVAFSLAFVAGCGGATTSDPQPTTGKNDPPSNAPGGGTAAPAGSGTGTGGYDTQPPNNAAKSCETVIASAFTKEGDYPGEKKVVSSEVQQCCEKQLLSTRGQMAHRWDCCANVAQTNKDVQMACTPWGPPVPPSIAWRTERLSAQRTA